MGSAPSRAASDGCERIPAPSGVDLLAALPLNVALIVFSQVPVDQLLRCREVSRSWRAFLDQPSALWETVDLSADSGVVAPLSEGLVRALAIRTAGQLRSLDVSGWQTTDKEVLFSPLLPLLVANRRCLRTLKLLDCCPWPTKASIDAVLAAARRLAEFHTDYDALYGSNDSATATDAVEFLRCEEKYGPLRVHKISIQYKTVNPHNEDLLVPYMDCQDFAAAVEAHPPRSVTGMRIAVVETVHDLGRVVDMALSLHLTHFGFECCHMVSLNPLPALTRLLRGGGVLRELEITGVDDDFESALDGSDGELDAFCEALEDSSLTSLKLVAVGLFGTDEDEPVVYGGLSVLLACTGHRTLQKLVIHTRIPRRAEVSTLVGRALAGILAHPGCLLHSLSVRCEAGFLSAHNRFVKLLFSAVGSSRTLRRLQFSVNPDDTPRFVQEVIMPAVTAQTSKLRATFNSVLSRTMTSDRAPKSQQSGSRTSRLRPWPR